MNGIILLIHTQQQECNLLAIRTGGAELPTGELIRNSHHKNRIIISFAFWLCVLVIEILEYKNNIFIIYTFTILSTTLENLNTRNVYFFFFKFLNFFLLNLKISASRSRCVVLSTAHMDKFLETLEMLNIEHQPSEKVQNLSKKPTKFKELTKGENWREIILNTISAIEENNKNMS